jgi:hypothetical protein
MAYDNAEQVYHVTDLDSLTPIGRTLKKGGSAIDGSTLTLQTKLVADDGTVVHNWTATGAAWSVAASGKAQYGFQSADLTAFQAADDEAVFWLWFRTFVTSGGSEYDSFPHDGRKLKIVVHKAE